MSPTSITANAIKAVFPYQTLCPTKDLTNDFIFEWFFHTRYNLAAVQSMLGGGNNGLIGLIMTPEYYHNRFGAQFVVPEDPGVTFYPTGSDATARANIDNLNSVIRTERAKVEHTTKIVIAQIVNACPQEFLTGVNNATTGLANVTLLQLFQHLYSYLQITSVDLRKNRDLMESPYDANQPIETLIERIRKCCQYADVAKKGYPEAFIMDCF